MTEIASAAKAASSASSSLLALGGSPGAAGAPAAEAERGAAGAAAAAAAAGSDAPAAGSPGAAAMGTGRGAAGAAAGSLGAAGAPAAVEAGRGAEGAAAASAEASAAAAGSRRVHFVDDPSSSPILRAIEAVNELRQAQALSDVARMEAAAELLADLEAQFPGACMPAGAIPPLVDVLKSYSEDESLCSSVVRALEVMIGSESTAAAGSAPQVPRLSQAARASKAPQQLWRLRAPAALAVVAELSGCEHFQVPNVSFAYSLISPSSLSNSAKRCPGHRPAPCQGRGPGGGAPSKGKARGRFVK